MNAGTESSGVSSAIAGPAWYAVWTRSRHEQVVREQLERKGIEAFLPTITRWSRWKDRKKKIDWPLFPGYCFVRFDGVDRLPVLKCTGVVNIVSFDGDIVADSRAGDRRHPPSRRKRAAVRSLPADSRGHDGRGRSHGPLKGVVGRLVRKGAHARLVLSVDLIGQASASRSTRRT